MSKNSNSQAKLNEWKYCDDKTVRPMSDWYSVVDSCIELGCQPTMLFYQKSER